MKSNCPRPTILVLALLIMGASDYGLAQRAPGGAKLTVSVTVSPICTVAVSAGATSSQEGVDVRCRNLPAAHPQPVVTDATAISEVPVESAESVELLEGAEITDTGEIAGNSSAQASSSLAMVVINF